MYQSLLMLVMFSQAREVEIETWRAVPVQVDGEPLLVNPRAHEANVRFIDDDLNRQFSDERLNDATSSAYEAERAREIVALCGPKGANASAAVCIDMHTTTSNMGCTIIVNTWSPLSIRAAAYVHEHWAAECVKDATATAARAPACCRRTSPAALTQSLE